MTKYPRYRGEAYVVFTAGLVALGVVGDGHVVHEDVKS